MRNTIIIVNFAFIAILYLGHFITLVPVDAVAYQSDVQQELKQDPAIIEIVYKWSPEKIQSEINKQAAKYGVKASVMTAVIKCESMGSTTIQSNYSNKGVREKSFGLAQIHLPDHPDITKEQAIDPMFAIEFMAKEMSEGRAYKWSCWNQLYGKSK